MIFSQKLAQAPWGKWEEARVIKTRAEEEIAKLKQLPGKDMVVWRSLSLAKSLIKVGLIDEYQFLVCPAILGDGRKVFPDNGPYEMNLIEVKSYKTGMVLMRYTPAPHKYK